MNRIAARSLAASPLPAAVASASAYDPEATIDVPDTEFDACHDPIEKGAGRIVGASCIGHKK